MAINMSTEESFDSATSSLMSLCVIYKSIRAENCLYLKSNIIWRARQ